MIILDMQQLKASEIPIVTIIVFIVFTAVLLYKIHKTKLYDAGARCVVITCIIAVIACMAEMKINKHPTGNYRYTVVFATDEPENLLDVYEIVGQDGDFYYLEDRR